MVRIICSEPNPAPFVRRGKRRCTGLDLQEENNISQLSVTLLAIQNGGLFSEIPKTKRPDAFNRVLRLVQSTVDRSINIPTFWRPWNAGSLVTVQTSPRASGENAR